MLLHLQIFQQTQYQTLHYQMHLKPHLILNVHLFELDKFLQDLLNQNCYMH